MKELIMRPEGRRTLPRQLHDDLGLTNGKRPALPLLDSDHPSSYFSAFFNRAEDGEQ